MHGLLAIGAGHRVALGVGSQIATPADFIVTNDAEWDAVMANTPAALAGKIIEIAAPASAFTQRTINAKDVQAAGGGLTIRSKDAASGLPSLKFDGVTRGVTCSGLNFQLQGWPKTYGSCVYFNNGTFGGLRFENCSFRHGYGAALADFDTTADLPEYTRVDNVQMAMFWSTTYALTWQDASATSGWIEFFNRGTSDVYAKVGGSGVSATTADTLIPARTNVRLTGLNPTTDTHIAILAASGMPEINARTEIGLSYYLGDGFGASGAATVEDVSVIGCTFRDLGSAVKGFGQPSSLTVMDCDFDRIYMDLIAGGPSAGGVFRVLRNLMCVPFSRSGIAENLNGDALDPHGDAFQMFSTGAATIGPVYVAGNRQRVGALRSGASSQGVFLSDNDITPSYDDVFVIDNAMTGGAVRQISLGETGFPIGAAFIYGNTLVDWADVANLAPAVILDLDASSQPYVAKTIAGSLSGVGASLIEDNSLALGNAASALAVFPNFAQLASATTKAQIEAALAPAAEGAGKGIGEDVIDWATSDPTQVIKWQNLPSGVHWNDLTNQAPSTLITLPLRKVLNPTPNQAVTPSAGTEWRAVDTDGVTEVQAWTSSSGTIQPDQFIQIRGTSAASGGTTMLGIGIGIGLQNVQIASASVPTQWLVSPGNTAYFQDTANPPAGLTRVTFKGKFYFPAGTKADEQRFFAQLSLGCDLFVKTSGFRPAVEDGTQSAMITGAPILLASSLVEDTWLDITFDVDQVAQLVTLTVNGNTETYPFDNASNGVFNTVRKFCFGGTGSTLYQLPAGVRLADLSVDFNGTLHKAISNDASVANADPWKAGTLNFTQGS